MLLIVAAAVDDEYRQSLIPVALDNALVNSPMALPTETVFSHGFDPLEGGINLGNAPFKVFSEWTEILPTDQVVATEYSLTGLPSR